MSEQFTKEYLAELQGYPLSMKLALTRQRIREWIHRYGTDGVYVSFSGGKDSTVLLHIVREMYPDVKAVFVDTGLEYPEIRQFVRTFDNVEWVKPKKNFRKVIEEYGYPFISKEVSECVSGARKYLTSLMAEMNAVDRQTDDTRTSIGTIEFVEQEHIRSIAERKHHPYMYETSHLFGTIRQCSTIKKDKGGGYDNKYRKLRGIGEYTKRTDGKQARRSKSKTCDYVGDANERQGSSDQGEYP